jgi:Core-2/I-Branching enzyme.
LLSGSDYPLKSVDYTARFFEQHAGQEFINSAKMPAEQVGKPLSSVEDYWFNTPFPAAQRINDFNKSRTFLTRNYSATLKDLQPYCGSTWWALANEACRYIPVSGRQTRSRCLL